MKVHTTNYINTFIEVAEDCPVPASEIPPVKGKQLSVANLQYEIINNHPYIYTSDEILFEVFAKRKGITKEDWNAERATFFSKGQACFRASPLCKRYGFGVHSDAESKLAIFGLETIEYQELLRNPVIAKVKAMRSKKSS